MKGTQWGAQPGEQEGASGGPTRRQLGPGPSLSPSSTGLLPGIMRTQMALGKWKGALQLCGAIIIPTQRKQRGEGTSSRPPSKKCKARTRTQVSRLPAWEEKHG